MLSARPLLPAAQLVIFIVITLRLDLLEHSLALHLPEEHLDVLESVVLSSALLNPLLGRLLLSGILVQQLAVIIVLQVIVRNFLPFLQENVPEFYTTHVRHVYRSGNVSLLRLLTLIEGVIKTLTQDLIIISVN